MGPQNRGRFLPSIAQTYLEESFIGGSCHHLEETQNTLGVDKQ